tara:strand:+ start:5 stop:463 length:459 start_codon:yes stop_codon:yes gene_type:complete
MNPKIWGPYAWFFIHSIALNYPKNPTFKNKLDYSNFFKSLIYVLPCEKCSIGYNKNIINNPIDNNLDNTEQLFHWTVDIHNMVNRETNKKTLNYQEAYDLHMNKYNHINIDNNIDNINYYKKYNNIQTFIIIFLIIIIAVLFFKKKIINYIK